MRLYLVQHGEALSSEADPSRPLSEQGRRDVTKLAAFLGHAGVTVSRGLHSGKTRAAQTAEVLAGVMLPEGALEVSEAINPNDPPAEFAGCIADWQEDSLVVGHLPFMAGLVAYLLGCDEDSAVVEYLPGSMVCLENDSTGTWRLAWMVRPELL
jgi:phosphohistidine phosphatase